MLQILRQTVWEREESQRRGGAEEEQKSKREAAHVGQRSSVESNVGGRGTIAVKRS